MLYVIAFIMFRVTLGILEKRKIATRFGITQWEKNLRPIDFKQNIIKLLLDV